MASFKKELAILLIAGGAAAECPAYQVTPFTAAAADRAGLQGAVDGFTAALGGANNGDHPGPIADGFRMIDWDGAAVPFVMPPDFFQTTRGALFAAEGGRFAVSNPVAGETPDFVDDDRFSSLLGAEQSQEFVAFSDFRLFTPVQDNVVDTTFSVPGDAHDPALVSAFGAVFADVDMEGTTKMTFLDAAGCHITELAVPVSGRGLSFAGVTVTEDGHTPKAAITTVKIELGSLAVVENVAGGGNRKLLGGEGDVVVLDDFIYGEPQPRHV